MRQLIFITASLFICFLFTQCGKKKTIMVKFIDAVTGEGIPDVEFGIYKEKFCISYDGCMDKELENGASNSDGSATFTFRQRKNGNHYLEYNAYKMEQRGYSLIGSNQFSLLDYDKNDNMEVKLMPGCLLKINYNNTNCFDENDKIAITYYNYSGTVNNIPDIITGCSGAQPANFGTAKAGDWIITYVVARNGNSQTFQESFYLIPFEENIINIDY